MLLNNLRISWNRFQHYTCGAYEVQNWFYHKIVDNMRRSRKITSPGMIYCHDQADPDKEHKNDGVFEHQKKSTAD